jgi:uncharacterized protein involved in exopolysaccharide biosynthesis
MREDEAALGLQIAEDNPTLHLEEEKGLGFLERLAVVAERKTFILKFVCIVTLAAAVVSFVLPSFYDANTKIMPPQQNPSSASVILNQLGPLAMMAGSQLGLRDPSEVYVDMLRSRTVADNLINRFSLMQVYHKSRIKDVRERLANLTEINAARDGVISVTVSDRDPQKAADLANAYIDELQKLSKTLAITEAARRRIFFEGEVQKAREELGNAEQALKETQENTGMIQLDSQSRAMIEAMITLRSQAAAKEAQVQSMRTFATAENPDLIRAEKELAAIQAQVSRFERGQSSGSVSVADLPVGKVPSAGLEFIRKYREVKYRESLVEVLTKQYEIARIDEGKDASIIQVLDKAVRPAERSFPARSMIVILAGFFAFWLAVVYVWFSQWLALTRENPQHADQLRRIRFYLFSRHSSRIA